MTFKFFDKNELLLFFIFYFFNELYSIRMIYFLWRRELRDV